MLLPVYLSGASKPKTIVLEKDSNKQPSLVYTGEAEKKIPSGTGELKYQINTRQHYLGNEYVWVKKELVVVSGTFDGYSVSDASVKIYRPGSKKTIIYKGDVEITVSEDHSKVFTLTNGIIQTPSGDLTVSNLSFATTSQSSELNEVGDNTFIREHSCTLKEIKIDSFSIDLLRSFGGESSVIVDYEEYGTLDEFVEGKYHFKIDDVFLKWEDGRTDTLEFYHRSSSIPRANDGKPYFPGLGLELSKRDHKFMNSNGDIISYRIDDGWKVFYYKKHFPSGVLEHDSGSFSVLSSLPEDLEPYMDNFPGKSVYSSKRTTKCKITYSDGAVYNGTVEHIENDNIFSLSSLPDSTMYWEGIYTAPSGIRTIYFYGLPKGGDYGQIIVNEKDFIAQSEANRIAKEEAKAEQERLEREEQERQEKEAKAREDRLVKTYGKYYTEFRDNGKILLGAPIKMFKEVTTVKLEINRKDMQVYDVWYGDSYYDYMYCEVDPKTGKITGTRTNPWN